MPYPNVDIVTQYGQISNYDSVRIGGVILPIVKGSIRGGTVLTVEHRKATGSDFAKYKSQGIDTIPPGCTFYLFIDYSKKPPKDWKREFEKIERLLVPKQLSARNAISVYHPSWSARGITQIIPTKNPILMPVAEDVWTYDFEGLDVRFIHGGTGGSSKQVQQDDLRVAGVVPQTVVKPDARVKGKALTAWPRNR